MTVKLDAADWRMLSELNANSRIKNCDLARCVGRSESSTLNRRVRLEKRGVIAGYTIIISAHEIGVLDQVVNVSVEGDRPVQYLTFEERLAAQGQIASMKRLIGRGRYQIRAFGADVAHVIEECAVASGLRIVAIHAEAIELEVKALRGAPLPPAASIPFSEI